MASRCAVQDSIGRDGVTAVGYLGSIAICGCRSTGDVVVALVGREYKEGVARVDAIALERAKNCPKALL
jgi:hypothetical protein